MNKRQKRILSIVLALSMIASMAAPGTAYGEGSPSPDRFAENNGPDKTACAHIHDETCGYSEGTARIPCDKGCADLDGDGAVEHEDGCAYSPETVGIPCTHVHDELCGGLENPLGPADDPSDTLPEEGGTLSTEGALDKPVPNLLSEVKDGGVSINTANFPDELFRDYVANFDTNGDGVLSASEIAAVTEMVIEIPVSSYDDSISVDLTGIKFFTSLEKLSFSSFRWGIRMKPLDLSGMTSLKELDCSHLSLRSLNVSGCTALEKLYCSGNWLDRLDVSGLSNLRELSCSDNREILNRPGKVARDPGDVYDDGITELNISGCTSLEILTINDNGIPALDLSQCTSLTYLDCSNNDIASLNVSMLSELETLRCDENKLTSLQVSGLSKLKALNCQYMKSLSSLDISNCPALTELYCEYNGLEELALSGCGSLEKLQCDNNSLRQLDISSLSNFTIL